MKGCAATAGRVGAAGGPKAIRPALYRLTADPRSEQFEDLLGRTRDLGDLEISRNLGVRSATSGRGAGSLSGTGRVRDCARRRTRDVLRSFPGIRAGGPRGRDPQLGRARGRAGAQGRARLIPGRHSARRSKIRPARAAAIRWRGCSLSRLPGPTWNTSSSTGAPYGGRR